VLSHHSTVVLVQLALGSWALSSITQAAATPAGQSQPAASLAPRQGQTMETTGARTTARDGGAAGRAGTPRAFTPRPGGVEDGAPSPERAAGAWQDEIPAAGFGASHSTRPPPPASGLQPRAEEDPPCLPACAPGTGRIPWPYACALACLLAWRCSHLPSPCLFFCLVNCSRSSSLSRPAGAAPIQDATPREQCSRRDKPARLMRLRRPVVMVDRCIDGSTIHPAAR
jgi:hypothetical protein